VEKLIEENQKDLVKSVIYLYPPLELIAQNAGAQTLNIKLRFLCGYLENGAAEQIYLYQR
jgi:hypothetical protein